MTDHDARAEDVALSMIDKPMPAYPAMLLWEAASEILAGGVDTYIEVHLTDGTLHRCTAHDGPLPTNPSPWADRLFHFVLDVPYGYEHIVGSATPYYTINRHHRTILTTYGRTIESITIKEY